MLHGRREQPHHDRTARIAAVEHDEGAAARRQRPEPFERARLAHGAVHDNARPPALGAAEQAHHGREARARGLARF